MKKSFFLIVIIVGLFAEKPGDYSIACENTKSTNANYDVYVNGWKLVGDGQKPIYCYVKQGQNEFKIIARENIDNISVQIIDYRNPKKTRIVADWNFDCRIVTNHTKTINLEMYGFTHPWQDADDLTSLSLADTTAISNAISNRVYSIEYEDGLTFGNYHSNTYSNFMTYVMASHNMTFEQAFKQTAHIQKKLFWGDGRKSFQKYNNIDYEFQISPFNPKVIYVDFKKNGADHSLWKLKSTYSDDAFNYDRQADGYRFFRKNGKWWMY